MTQSHLTARHAAVTPGPNGGAHRMVRIGLRMGSLALIASVPAGCINVAAPDEPIVIELNINIRQEVIYRLADDAAEAIEENADIF